MHPPARLPRKLGGVIPFAELLADLCALAGARPNIGWSV